MAHELVVDAPLKTRAIDAAGVDSGAQPTTLEGNGLPWSYGRDRITLIVRDPDWAYAYWEITDEGIADARRRLGSEGSSAFCNLRVYDTTGRLFNGANANDFFDPVRTPPPLFQAAP